MTICLTSNSRCHENLRALEASLNKTNFPFFPYCRAGYLPISKHSYNTGCNLTLPIHTYIFTYSRLPAHLLACVFCTYVHVLSTVLQVLYLFTHTSLPIRVYPLTYWHVYSVPMYMCYLLSCKFSAY